MKIRRPRNKLVYLLALLWLSPLSAEIYKQVDSNGIISYSDRRPKSGNYKVMHFKCNTCGWRSNVNWENVRLDINSFTREILDACERWAVEESLVRAVIHAESSFRKQALSDMGAQGLMQLMPETARRFGVSRPFEPRQNIDAGVRYLRELLDRFDGDYRLASAAYNAGPGAVSRHGGVPPYNETQNFVQRVKILERRYSRAL
jgi:soluble lytic murein transglycosylase-like protein